MTKATELIIWLLVGTVTIVGSILLHLFWVATFLLGYCWVFLFYYLYLREYVVGRDI